MKNPVKGPNAISDKFKTIVVRGYNYYFAYGHSHGRNWENNASRDVGLRIVRNK
jgi:hypothetical protein